MMKQATQFIIHPGWKLLISDVGLDPAEVLALARLPADFFAQKVATLSVNRYFEFWRAIEKAAGNKDLPLLIGQKISVEAFDPPIFASLCSANLNVALQRLSEFKRLIGPMVLTVNQGRDDTAVSIDCYQHSDDIPHSLGTAELVFFTKLARLATRQEIIPARVIMTKLPENIADYETYFGVTIQQGNINKIHFKSEDAIRPFLTENMGMWSYFETGLKQRLCDLDTQESTSQRAKSALLEMLPSGESSMEQVAERLVMSKRTLQRRLSGEGNNFQLVLKATREELAQFYLTNSSMSQGEISFLLGFQDTNSFIRAYSSWTGKSPGQYRSIN